VGQCGLRDGTCCIFNCVDITAAPTTTTITTVTSTVTTETDTSTVTTGTNTVTSDTSTVTSTSAAETTETAPITTTAVGSATATADTTSGRVDATSTVTASPTTLTEVVGATTHDAAAGVTIFRVGAALRAVVKVGDTVTIAAGTAQQETKTVTAVGGSGSLTLDSPLAFGHSSGTEVTLASGSGSSTGNGAKNKPSSGGGTVAAVVIVVLLLLGGAAFFFVKQRTISPHAGSKRCVVELTNPKGVCARSEPGSHHFLGDHVGSTWPPPRCALATVWNTFVGSGLLLGYGSGFGQGWLGP
jgi:hypothetical protein